MGDAHGRQARPRSSRDESIDAVLVASRVLVGVAARSLATTEDTITLVQYRTLVLLGSRGEMNVGSVAAALDVHQSTATRLCDRLVAKGLVNRRTSEESRREVFIALTRTRQSIGPNGDDTSTTGDCEKIMDRLQPTERTRLAEAFLAFAGTRPAKFPTRLGSWAGPREARGQPLSGRRNMSQSDPCSARMGHVDERSCWRSRADQRRRRVARCRHRRAHRPRCRSVRARRRRRAVRPALKLSPWLLAFMPLCGLILAWLALHFIARQRAGYRRRLPPSVP